MPDLAVTETDPALATRSPLLRVARLPSFITTTSVIIVAVIVIAAIFANLVSPQNPNQAHLAEAFGSPSGAHPLGQDSAGRDILSRLVHGARLSLVGPLLVVLLATLVGVPMGLLAGYRGGWVDGILSRIFDVVFAFPPLLLAIVVVAAFGPGFTTVVIAVAITYVPLMARIVRSATLVEREKPYVEACVLQGFGAMRVCTRHIGPSLTRLVSSQLAVYFAYSLLDLAALSYLGLGTQPPTADWGAMLSNANQGIFESPAGVLPPAVAIVALVISVSLLADRLADWSERG
jgi:ABC-type dipeptide/oligopeptide/nickel transport system permease subunit